jgi:hypothetical protein
LYQSNDVSAAPARRDLELGSSLPGLFGNAQRRQNLVRSFFLLAKQPAGLSIDQMQPSASFACDGFILGFRRVLIIVQPVLNF